MESSSTIWLHVFREILDPIFGTRCRDFSSLYNYYQSTMAEDVEARYSQQLRDLLLVCKAWKELLHERKSWIARYGFSENDTDAQCPHARRVTFRLYSDDSLAEMHALVARLPPSVASIRFMISKRFSDAELGSKLLVSNNQPHSIRALHLLESTWSIPRLSIPMESLSIAYPRLTSLDLRGILDPVGSLDLPSLEILFVTFSRYPDDKWQASIDTWSIPSLRWLSLYLYNYDHEKPFYIRSWKHITSNLESFRLAIASGERDHNRYFPVGGINFRVTFPRLKELIMDGWVPDFHLSRRQALHITLDSTLWTTYSHRLLELWHSHKLLTIYLTRLNWGTLIKSPERIVDRRMFLMASIGFDSDFKLLDCERKSLMDAKPKALVVPPSLLVISEESMHSNYVSHVYYSLDTYDPLLLTRNLLRPQPERTYIPTQSLLSLGHP